MSRSALALVGSADLPGFGDQLMARVLANEFARRLPRWRIDHLGPLGWDPSVAATADLMAQPLGTDTHGGVAGLTERYQVAVLAPAFPLGAPLPSQYPRDTEFPTASGLGIPFAVRAAGPLSPSVVEAFDAQPFISCRDALTAERLTRIGFQDRTRLVGHPGVLAETVLDRNLLGDRLAALRELSVIPSEGSYLVLHGSEHLLTDLDRLAASVEHAAREADADHVVILPEPPVAMEDVRPGWSVASLPCLEDRLAVLAGAAAVLAGDEHVEACCAGLRVPCAHYAPSQGTTVRPSQLAMRPTLRSAEALRAERASLSQLLDEVAEYAETSGPVAEVSRRFTELTDENEALRRANRALRSRMTNERKALVERIVHLQEQQSTHEALEHEKELHAALAEKYHGAIADLDRTRNELHALRQTKLYRWTRLPRLMYEKLRS